ncbi:MAG: helix-turn-helix transcriptional regulator [Gammaproteobacteria bacterium]
MATRTLISSADLVTQYLPEQHCRCQPLPHDLGNGTSRFYQLDDDFQLITTDYTPRKNLTIGSRIETAEPRMVVTLGLKGHSTFETGGGKQLQFEPGYTSITVFNCVAGERRFSSEQNVLQLRFSVGLTWLTRHFEMYQNKAIFSGGKFNLLSHRPISVSALQAAKNLLGANVTGASQHLFRHGLAQAILASELSPLLEENNNVNQRFGPREQTMARRARDILWNEFKCPPSVPILARRVGTNTCKLKQSLHYFYATTPYGVVLESRMHRARDLLKTDQYSIAMVAEAVGYQHASNFSTAFTRYFGYSPKLLKRDL